MALLVLLLAALLAPLPLRAQGTISGIVFDSVGMRPLAGARVQLVAAADPARARTVESDPAGRFAFDSVARGDWLLGFLHPRADSLLLRSPTRRLSADGSGVQQVVLALPSPRTLVARVCRVEFGADSLGLLVGTVRDALDGSPRAGITLRAQWREVTFRDRGMFETTETTEATTLPDGGYALCGMPAGATVMMVAGGGADSTGSFEYEFPAAGYAVRDLVVGRAERRVSDTGAGEREALIGGGRTSGRVLDQNSAPVVGAIVRSWRGDAEVRTGADGHFRLDSIPMGTQTIHVRAIGFLPERRTVDVRAASFDASPGTEVTLAALARVSLDTARVTVRRVYTSQRSLARMEERRRRAAVGHFMGPEEITRKDPLRVSDLLRQIPGVMVLPNFRGSGYIVTMSGGEGISTGRCRPSYWLDGVEVFGGMDLDSFVSGSEILALEVYTRQIQVPAEFQRLTGCGVIVVWTGARDGRRR